LVRNILPHRKVSFTVIKTLRRNEFHMSNYLLKL
jgi:hypothetical protein